MAHRCHTEVIAHILEDLHVITSSGKAERDGINNIILRDTCMQCEHRDEYEDIQYSRTGISFLATTYSTYLPSTCLLAWNLSSVSETVLLSHDLDQIDACSTPEHYLTLPYLVPNTQDRAVRKLAKTTQGCRRCCRSTKVPYQSAPSPWHAWAQVVGLSVVRSMSARPVSDVAVRSASE